MTTDPRRYCNQPRVVRCLRWLRWMPPRIALAGFHTLVWATIGGCRPLMIDGLGMEDRYQFTRRETLRHIWQANVWMAQMRMGHYLTADEFIRDLRLDDQAGRA